MDQAGAGRIETKRLVLRSPVMDDAARIADLIGDFPVVRMLSNVPYPYDHADAVRFLSEVAGEDPAHTRSFAIEHRTFGLIGGIGFHHGEDPWPELGYWLGRTFWGCGFATEAARWAMRWADRGWGRKVVGSGHFADNPASGGVLTKAGFLYTGERRRRPALARGLEIETRMMIRLA